jgi:hypothetical protein
MAVAPRSCPVCDHPATLTDWGPHLPWIGVEDCACSGFFVWAPLLDWRLPRLDRAEREALAANIRSVRAMGREAWLTCAEPDRLFGRLVILAERPDRPT